MMLTNQQIRDYIRERNELSAKIVDVQHKINLYTEVMDSAEFASDEYTYAYQQRRKYRMQIVPLEKRKRELENLLESCCNLEAFSYDSYVDMGDEYFERKLRRDGCIVGIKF